MAARILIIVLAVILLLALFISIAAPTADDRTIIADDGKQAEQIATLKNYIELGLSEGLFARVGYDGGTLPKVWVTDAFLAGNTREQNKVLQPIWVYYSLTDNHFQRHDVLVIKCDDGTVNGRRIGWYDPINGLH